MAAQTNLLTLAHRIHKNAYPSHDIMVGMNFIECFTCNKHAYQHNDNDYLIAHNATYSINERLQNANEVIEYWD